MLIIYHRANLASLGFIVDMLVLSKNWGLGNSEDISCLCLITKRIRAEVLPRWVIVQHLTLTEIQGMELMTKPQKSGLTCYTRL